MKGLLHSKKFRTNLYKWLCAYVGVMLLLTTVITYSKYISKFLGETETPRTAKFDVEIKPITCHDEKTGKTCNQDSYWSTLPVAYYFYVDTSALEVTTRLKVTIDVNENFEVESIEEITNLTEISNQAGVITNMENIMGTPLTYSYTTKGLILLPNYDNIGAKTGGKKGYRVILKYIGENKIDTNYKILKVNYAAEQIN